MSAIAPPGADHREVINARGWRRQLSENDSSPSSHPGAEGGWITPKWDVGDDGSLSRYWDLPDGQVTAVSFDYEREEFVGCLNAAGDEWSSPFRDELLEHIADGVEGWCTHEQGRALYELAREQADHGGGFVEIGSRKGLSATWIGWGSKVEDGPEVTCVDTFQGPTGSTWRRNVLEEWEENMVYAGLRDHSKAWMGPSLSVVTDWPSSRPISLLYIDALHSYAGAKGDLMAWGAFCRPGSIICFDDCIPDFPGILKLMRQLDALDRFELIGRADAMLAWRVTEGS